MLCASVLTCVIFRNLSFLCACVVQTIRIIILTKKKKNEKIKRVKFENTTVLIYGISKLLLGRHDRRLYCRWRWGEIMAIGERRVERKKNVLYETYILTQCYTRNGGALWYRWKKIQTRAYRCMLYMCIRERTDRNGNSLDRDFRSYIPPLRSVVRSNLRESFTLLRYKS